MSTNWEKLKLNLQVLILFGLAATFCFAGTTDRIVAKVGDEVILASELKTALDFVKIQSEQPAIPDTALTHQILDQLIEDRLVLNEAKRETINVTKSEIDNEVETSIRELISRFPSPADFEKALTQEGLTERALRDRYREDTKNRLTVQKLLAKKGLTNIYISPSETKRFYQEKKDSIAVVPGNVSLAHILFRIMPTPDAEQNGQKKSLEIYDILLRGGDFEEVARSFSEDKNTSARGGYLGELQRGTLFEPIDSVLFLMKPGDISPPLRSPMGYQIFQVLGKSKSSVKVNHILIKVPITRADTLQAKKFAQSVRLKILAGADFDTLARLYSDDPETREQGGFLGQFLIKGLMPPFGPVVEKMHTGEVSEPVLSEHGFHLIKVLEKQEDKILSYEEMQEKIKNYLYQEQLANRLKDYLDRVSGRTFVAKLI
jgi:peptidyl-prolyl cis-trans isomerase SurA